MRPRVLALALVITASACKSQPPADRPDRADSQRSEALLAMQPPRVSLLSAIEIAQGAYPAGRVLGAGVEIDSDQPRMFACVVEGENLHALRIDAWNRRIVSDVIDDGSRAFVEMATALREHPEQVPIDFATAIESAHGTIPAAWPSTVFLFGGDGKPYVYAVELVSRDAVRSFEVNAADGTLRTDDDRAFRVSSLDPLPASGPASAEAPAISLSESIALARKRQPDGYFLHAEFGDEKGHEDYLVAFWTRHGVYFVYLDATSGAARIEGTSDPDPEMAARMHRLAASSQSLIEPAIAIQTAIDAVPGSWASMIDVDSEVEPLVYHVEVLSGALVKYVRVRATDGKLLGVTSAEDEEQDP